MWGATVPAILAGSLQPLQSDEPASVGSQENLDGRVGKEGVGGWRGRGRQCRPEEWGRGIGVVGRGGGQCKAVKCNTASRHASSMHVQIASQPKLD